MQAGVEIPRIIQGKGASFGTGYHTTPPTRHKRRRNQWGIGGFHQLLMRVCIGTGKGMSGLNKFGSVDDIMLIKLESKQAAQLFDNQDPAP